MKFLLRGLFIIFTVAFALQSYLSINEETLMLESEIPYIYGAIAFVIAVTIVFFEARFQRSLVREIVAISFGLAFGIVISSFMVALAVVFVLPAQGGSFADAFERVQIWIPLIVTAVCYMSITIVLQTRGDFRFLVPYIDFSHRGQEEGGFILDTSVLVDGRIVDISKTNIIGKSLIIPDFVLRELQTIADSSDRLKRKRGRRGLDMVAALQQADNINVQVIETDVPEKCDVDQELVVLAKQTIGRIITNDFNLNKVAQIDGIKVINLNDLSNAMKPVVLPGEPLQIKIIRNGDEAGQGVGYLDDGTMVVVEGGRDKIGENIDIVITGSIQTSAGRLVFGRYNPDGRKSQI